MRREMEDMRVGQDPEEASSGEQDPEEEHTVVPLEIAAGPKLDDVARDAMRRFGLERVTNQFARCVADCVAKASGGDVAEIDVNAPWVTATNTSERANEHTAPAEGTAPDAAKRRRRRRFCKKCTKRRGVFARRAIRICLRRRWRCSARPRWTETWRRCASATARPAAPRPCRWRGLSSARRISWKSAPGGGGVFVEDAPRALDLSRSGMRDAEAQRLVAALAGGAAPALRSCASRGTTRSPR